MRRAALRHKDSFVTQDLRQEFWQFWEGRFYNCGASQELHGIHGGSQTPPLAFDWGLSFFCSKTVYTGIEDSAVPGAGFTGPSSLTETHALPLSLSVHRRVSAGSMQTGSQNVGTPSPYRTSDWRNWLSSCGEIRGRL